jgi:hypothetical protein
MGRCPAAGHRAQLRGRCREGRQEATTRSNCGVPGRRSCTSHPHSVSMLVCFCCAGECLERHSHAVCAGPMASAEGAACKKHKAQQPESGHGGEAWTQVRAQSTFVSRRPRYCVACVLLVGARPWRRQREGRPTFRPSSALPCTSFHIAAWEAGVCQKLTGARSPVRPPAKALPHGTPSLQPCTLQGARQCRLHLRS